MKDKSNKFRYLVEVWVYHRIVDSRTCVSLNEAREWLSEEGWIKAWAHGGCAFEVFKDGKEVSFGTLYKNKFYDEDKEE